MDPSGRPLPTAGAIMNREVLTLSPELPIGEAVTLLVRRGFSGAPVVERDGRLVGVLSEIDCLRVLSAAAFHVMPTGTVGDHMTGAVQSVGPEVDLLQVASTLEQ